MAVVIGVAVLFDAMELDASPERRSVMTPEADRGGGGKKGKKGENDSEGSILYPSGGPCTRGGDLRMMIGTRHKYIMLTITPMGLWIWVRRAATTTRQFVDSC